MTKLKKLSHKILCIISVLIDISLEKMILKWVCIIAVLLAKYHFYIVYSFISIEEISPTYKLNKAKSRSIAGK